MLDDSVLMGTYNNISEIRQVYNRSQSINHK